MRITRGRLIAAGIGVLAVAGTAYVMRPRPLLVDTGRVARAPLETIVDADGRTRVRERYVVVSPVSGRVERIEGREGIAVRAGDIVARVRPAPLDAPSAAQVQARVDAASAIALDAANQVRVATAAVTQRRRELARARRLQEAGALAPATVEEGTLALVEAEGAAHAAEARARAADADLRQARALLPDESGARAPVLVRAPAAGRILRVAERSERIVAAGTPLVEIGDPGSIEIVVDVLSGEGATVHAGDRVRLVLPGAGDESERETVAAGRVREVEPAAFTKVSALGVDEQRVNVIVDPVAPLPLVGDGFRVEAQIVVWAAPDVLTIPRSALVQLGDDAAGRGWAAFVVRDGRAVRRLVRVGHVGGEAAEVVAGVDTGDEVVVFPSEQVAPGVRVRRRG